jgi:hypothetical protein
MNPDMADFSWWQMALIANAFAAWAVWPMGSASRIWRILAGAGWIGALAAAFALFGAGRGVALALISVAVAGLARWAGRRMR